MRLAERVWITGIGLYTGLGGGREPSWDGLKGGQCGLRRLGEKFDPASSEFVGCPVRHSDHRPSEHGRKAAMEAVADAGIGRESDIDRDRVATVLSLSKGDLVRLALGHKSLREGGSEALSAASGWRGAWPDAWAAGISHVHDFRGPSLAPIAACASGVLAAIQGADLIRLGACDLALVGAADASLHPLVLGAFRNMRVLARVEGDPARAVRPWDRARSGFLPGEGAAVLVLEREGHARGRGVLPYAEFSGGAFGSDAYHLTDLNPDPSGLAHLIRRALANADVDASEIDHVNVHGTATRQNDPLECRAIRSAFGGHADSISCSANKPQIGHLLGAAGAAELAITCLAIRDGFVPPTLNLDDPDPACDLDGTPHVGKAREIRAALKLSIGFGGHLAAAVLRRPSGPRREAAPRE